MADLLTVPFSSKRKRYLQELAGGIDEQQPGPKKAKTDPQANGQGTEQLAASHYILTPQQMRDREFAPSLYTEGLALAPGFTDTLPAGVKRTAPSLGSPLCLLLLQTDPSGGPRAHLLQTAELLCATKRQVAVCKAWLPRACPVPMRPACRGAGG